jgi:hypothetical protein
MDILTRRNDLCRMVFSQTKNILHQKFGNSDRMVPENPESISWINSFTFLVYGLHFDVRRLIAESAISQTLSIPEESISR